MKTVDSDFILSNSPRLNIKETDVIVQDVAVNINGGEFIFVFATGLENQGG